MHSRQIMMAIIVCALVWFSVLAASAADNQATALNARVESVDKQTKTVTLSVETMHNIKSFLQAGDEIEIVIEEESESQSQPTSRQQKRLWRMQRAQKPFIQKP